MSVPDLPPPAPPDRGRADPTHTLPESQPVPADAARARPALTTADPESPLTAAEIEAALGPGAPAGHVTVVEQVSRHLGLEQPWAVANTYMTLVGSDEQVYERHTRVGEGWRPLDCGWVRGAAVLILRNDEGRQQLQVNPSPQEVEAVARRVVQLGVRPGSPPASSGAGGPADRRFRTMFSPEPVPDLPPSPVADLRPGESLRLRPSALASLSVRCLAGEARITVVAVPD